MNEVVGASDGAGTGTPVGAGTGVLVVGAADGANVMAS